MKLRRTPLDWIIHHRYHVVYFPLLGAWWAVWLWWVVTK